MRVYIGADRREVSFHKWLKNDLGTRFYVYVLSRPGGEPFYVGMGKNRRLEHHERIARTGDDSHKSRVIRSIWNGGLEVERSIVEIVDDRKSAEAIEISLIRRFGRSDNGSGTLVNHTDGGDGGIGRTISKEHKLAISAFFKGKKRPEHVIRAVTAAHLGSVRSEETKERMRKAWTPERKMKHAEACRARIISQSTRDAISKANSGRKVSRDVVTRRANLIRGRKQTEDQRRNSGAGVSRSWTPERRAAQAERMRKMRRDMKNAAE